MLIPSVWVRAGERGNDTNSGPLITELPSVYENYCSKLRLGVKRLFGIRLAFRAVAFVLGGFGFLHISQE
jgi:hypothetical protein